MTEFHKIFIVERDGDTLILMPQDIGFAFRYADVQIESNAVRRVLDGPGVTNLLVDFGKLDYFGSEFIGAIVSLAQHAAFDGGQVVFCNASERMLEVLETMNLAQLWPYFSSREEALQSFRQ